MQGKDTIKKQFNKDEERFRDYIEAIGKEIVTLEVTITKFQGKLKHEKELKAKALEMTLKDFLALPKH